MTITPADYLTLEIYAQPLEDFRLGSSRLAYGRLGEDPDGDDLRWIDVTCRLLTVTISQGGRDVAASSAQAAGHLSLRAKNTLNPLHGWDVHPGTPIRVRDGDELVFTGSIDDLRIEYGKATADYFLVISASDRLRELKAKTVRGEPGAIGSLYHGSIGTRVNELAHVAGLELASPLPAHGYTFGVVMPLTNWNRFGTQGGGYSYGIVDYEDRVYIRDNITGTNGANVTEGTRGMQATLTGLTAGQLYETTVEFGLFGTYTSNFNEDVQSFRISIGGSNPVSISAPVSIGWKGRRRFARASVVFRPTGTWVILRAYRAYSGVIGNDEDASWIIGETRTRTWNGEASGIRPLQPVAYESTAYNHLVMAADSAGMVWTITRDGKLALERFDNEKPVVARLSDVHDTVDPLHGCYTDIELAYDTADVVNSLEIENHGRKPSNELEDGWIVDDETLDIEADAFLLERYRPRDLRLDMQLPPYLLTARTNELLTRYSIPRETIRSVTINALEQAQARQAVAPNAQVEITHRGHTDLYRVTGIRQDVTPTSHLISYSVEKVKNPT